MAFANQPSKSTYTQRSLLAAVMLVILLGCAAWVWYIVQTRTNQPLDNAKTIITEIRSKTLSFYWKDKPELLLYAIYDPQGKPVGWQASGRRRADDGYEGSQWTGLGLQEAWKLNNAATIGKYAGQFGPTDSRIVHILLNDRELSVAWAQKNTEVAKAPPIETPPTYIPEGLMHLVIRMVAQSGKPATFHMITNSESIVLGHVNFNLVRMEPIGRSVQLEIFSLEGASAKMNYLLDENGTVQRIEEPSGVIIKLVPAEELLQQWPDDPALQKLIEQNSNPATQETK